MVDEHSGNPDLHENTRLPTAVASLAVGVAFFALWFWLLPLWQARHVGGGWLWFRPSAPVAPPKRLVVVGFYRHVRNPMYAGFAVGWIGLWIVFGHANLVAIAAVAAVALGVHLFVVFYEEPTPREKFGAQCEEYRNVHRWWPHVRGWDRTQQQPLRVQGAIMSENPLIELLYGKGAPVSPLACVEDLSAQLAGSTVNGFPHSVWQVLKHLNYWMDYELNRIDGRAAPYPVSAAVLNRSLPAKGNTMPKYRSFRRNCRKRRVSQSAMLKS